MAQTIGSLDLNAFSDLYSDSIQYFWFEGDASATYGAGVHVTLVPDTSFISNPTGQNILMNTDGFSMRSGLLPMMTLNNNSLDFNVVDTTEGTYTNVASFGRSQTFNNEYSRKIFEIGRLNNVSRTGKVNWTEYDNTSPFEYVLPWNCSSVNSTKYYDSNYDLINDLTGAVSYTLSGRTITWDATACTTLQSYSVAYIRVSYSATGDFPYFTLGSDGIGDIGAYSYREGENCVASGITAHAEGESTTASASNSHAEGYMTTASGDDSHAEGNGTTASGDTSHAEGVGAIASGFISHAEGEGTTASKSYCHAEGYGTTASGLVSHTEGWNTTASGSYSHAQNYYTVASGSTSHAQNYHTVADQECQTAIGRYNTESNTNNLFVIGNGTSSARSDAFSVDKYGNVVASGTISASVETLSPNTTTTTGQYVSSSACRFGSVVHLTFVFRKTGSTASGSNVYQGTLTGVPAPASTVTGSGYWTTHALPLSFTPSKVLIIRNAGSTSMSMDSSDTCTVGFTYITNEN